MYDVTRVVSYVNIETESFSVDLLSPTFLLPAVMILLFTVTHFYIYCTQPSWLLYNNSVE